jgi:hypothetical protein
MYINKTPLRSFLIWYYIAVKSKQLERKLTPLAEFNDLFIALLPVIIISILISSANRSELYIPIPILLLGIIGWLIYHNVSFKNQLNSHKNGLISLASANQWKLQTSMASDVLPNELTNSSLLLVANRDQKTVNYLETTNWNYIDISYCVYRPTRYGEYKAAYVYCSALAAKLPRILPNIFFDSNSQKGARKYKANFVKDQRHSLEGNFDKYFDTYFAEGYTIDSMSFITPDVMVALENASEYDIEIIGDNLLMYGPVYIDANKITEGANKLQAILKTLQVTASAYEDTRLPGEAGRQTVSAEGLQLKRKNNFAKASIIFVLAYVVLRVVITLLQLK